MRTTVSLAALGVLSMLLSASNVRAQFVVPASYSFGVAPTANGDFSYPDSGGELTDGTTGLSFSHYSVPSDAGPWTGWYAATPSITFRFDSPQTFSRIEIGTTRLDASGIGVLTGVTLASSTFSTGVTLPNDNRDWLVFDGTFSTSVIDGFNTLTISLTTGSQWIMLDEVRFTAVPEPATTTIVISLAAVGVLILTRRRRFSPARTA